jgi:hypothetical protein
MGSGDAVAGLAGKFAELRPHLGERAWRLYLGSEARALAAVAETSLTTGARRGLGLPALTARRVGKNR